MRRHEGEICEELKGVSWQETACTLGLRLSLGVCHRAFVGDVAATVWQGSGTNVKGRRRPEASWAVAALCTWPLLATRHLHLLL